MAFGIWTGLLATSSEWLGTLQYLLWISAVLMLFGLPGEILGSHERLHRIPRSLRRALGFSAILVQMAERWQAPELVRSPWLRYPFSLVLLPFREASRR